MIFLSYEIEITSLNQNSWFNYIASVSQQISKGDFEEFVLSAEGIGRNQELFCERELRQSLLLLENYSSNPFKEFLCNSTF